MRKFWTVALVLIGVVCIGVSAWYFIDYACQGTRTEAINEELRQLKNEGTPAGAVSRRVEAVSPAEGGPGRPAEEEEILLEAIPEDGTFVPAPDPEPVTPPIPAADPEDADPADPDAPWDDFDVTPDRRPSGKPRPSEESVEAYHFLSDEELEAMILPQYKAIYQRNSDFIGWLVIPGLEVDHPVVQTIWDNSYYLYRDFNGEENKNGTLILDAACEPFQPSPNLIIYGHKMQSGAMFGTLDRYEKLSWWQEHPLVQFDTLIEERQYVVVACLRAVQLANNGPGSFHYVMEFADDEDFENWLARIRRARYYDPGVDFGVTDRYLTLSTCSYHDDNGRLLVIARALREDEKPEDFLPRE